jgi:hypothetical protein
VLNKEVDEDTMGYNYYPSILREYRQFCLCPTDTGEETIVGLAIVRYLTTKAKEPGKDIPQRTPGIKALTNQILWSAELLKGSSSGWDKARVLSNVPRCLKRADVGARDDVGWFERCHLWCYGCSLHLPHLVEFGVRVLVTGPDISISLTVTYKINIHTLLRSGVFYYRDFQWQKWQW